MSRHLSMRREAALRERAVRDRQGDFGDVIWWYALDSIEMHPIYDEPGERKYKPRANVPILWWFDTEGGDRLTPEGRELYRALEFGVRAEALRNAGIEPEADDRLGDMVLWDDFAYEVVEFTPTSQALRGHPIGKRGRELTVRVTAIRRYPASDMPHDWFPDSEPPPTP
jgi:hypothetical protein